MLIKIYKKRRSHPKMALLEAGRDLNPWSLHRNIYWYTYCYHANFLFRPAATAPTAFIIVFFILDTSFPNILKSETPPRTSWKYVGIGNPSAHDTKLVITTKRLNCYKIN